MRGGTREGQKSNLASRQVLRVRNVGFARRSILWRARQQDEGLRSLKTRERKRPRSLKIQAQKEAEILEHKRKKEAENLKTA
jgi:hypothetical protein